MSVKYFDTGDLSDRSRSKEVGVRVSTGKNKRTARKNTGTNQSKIMIKSDTHLQNLSKIVESTTAPGAVLYIKKGGVFMQHVITITQKLMTTIEVSADNEASARDIGNKIIEKDLIPFRDYDMVEASVCVEGKQDVSNIKKIYDNRFKTAPGAVFQEEKKCV